MFLNVVFDIILVGILLYGAAMGIKNGFLITIAKPVKFIASLVLAFSLASVVGTYLIEPIIGPAISNRLSEILIEKYSEITAETASESLPTLIKIAAGICGVDIEGIAAGADGISVIEAVVDAVTSPVVHIIGIIFGFVIAYFIAKLVVNFVMIFINSFVNKGVAGKVNKALGCVFSVFFAFVIGWAFTSISEFIFNIPAIASIDWVQNFNGGAIYRFFRTFTPLDLLLSF